MPRTHSLFSITLRRTTNIIMVDSYLTMIQGGLRHIDGSTTITNRDAFNIENTVTEQQSPPTASLIVGTEGKFIPWVLKASRVIYNGLIQRQLPWYLRIPPLHVKHKIQTELQVRDKFQWTFEIGTYKLFVYARYSFRHSRITARGNGSIGA